MKVNITLPIYIYDEADLALENLGVETSMENSPTEPMTFYEINAIGPYKEKDHIACSIFCNSREFITSLTYEQVFMKLKQEDENNK